MSDKVVSIFDAKKKEKTEETKEKASEAKDSELSFDEIMKKNKAIEERMKKERLNANKSVLRSYRIKN
jgi:hypothetical protein